MQWKKSGSLTETEQPKEPFLQALRVLCERVWPDWGVRAAYLEREVSSQVRIVSWGEVMHYQCSGARLEPMADLINLLMRKRDAEASAGPSSSAACNTTMVNQTVTVSTVHYIKLSDLAAACSKATPVLHVGHDLPANRRIRRCGFAVTSDMLPVGRMSQVPSAPHSWNILKLTTLLDHMYPWVTNHLF